MSIPPFSFTVFHLKIDGNHPGYVETGLEIVSLHLVKSIMPGKVKPYTIEEWSDVIDNALGILDDSHWFTVASMMMTSLPKETEQDVIESIRFIDSMKLPMTIMLRQYFYFK